MNTSNKRIVLLVTAAIAAIGILVFLIIMGGAGQKSSTVQISNLKSCSKDINPVVVDEIQKDTYSLVKSANNFNKKDTSARYKATIRSGSCNQLSDKNVRGFSGNTVAVKTTSIILDVPDAHQSWKIKYDWVSGRGNIDTDIGTIQPSCVDKNQLLYGDFKCENILSLAKYGTEQTDPILQYMPYTGVGFRMEYDSNSKTVTVFFDPPSGTTDAAAFITNTKAIIPYWFQKRNLDQSKYKIFYSDQVDSPDDNQQ